jgi:UDP-N-acetylglucosamine 2-epimerase (non-hydrolysing)
VAIGVNGIRALFSFGTRPEAIKLAPLVRELSSRSRFVPLVCVTAQHRELLDQVLALFGIRPDRDLDIMVPEQSLERVTRAALEGVAGVLDELRPDLVVVQGDTTTTFASALAAFYRQIRVAHVEAGLRTANRYAPFPEEMNRRMTSCLADWHFAPTAGAARALLAEGVPTERIFTVGNTVIDALLAVLERARRLGEDLSPRLGLEDGRRLLLVTCHRRESFGAGLESICSALRRIAESHPDLVLVYPVHPNPRVREPVHRALAELDNVRLVEPQDYLSLVWLLDRCFLVLTDSGGIQEEAPTLGKPVLVMREVTERPEAVDAGAARLVGTGADRIVATVEALLEDEQAYREMSRAQNPFGDGTASRRIADVLEAEL